MYFPKLKWSESELQMLDNCIPSHCVSFGAIIGDSHGSVCFWSQRSMSPQDTRSIFGIIYILRTIEIKNKTLVNQADGKPLWRWQKANSSKSTGAYPKWTQRFPGAPCSYLHSLYLYLPHTRSRRGHTHIHKDWLVPQWLYTSFLWRIAYAACL